MIQKYFLLSGVNCQEWHRVSLYMGRHAPCSKWSVNVLVRRRQAPRHMAPVPDEAAAATREPEVRGCGVGGAAPPAGRDQPCATWHPGLPTCSLKALLGRCLVTHLTVLPGSMQISAFIKQGLASSDSSGPIKCTRLSAINHRGGGLEGWASAPHGAHLLRSTAVTSVHVLWPSKDASLVPAPAPRYFTL